MRLNFEIKKTKENAHGTFIIGKFVEKPPLFASDQKFKLEEFEFRI